MLLQINEKVVKVEHIRVFRDALGVRFHALIGNEWIYFHKGKRKNIPTYSQMDWPNPKHPYGWSFPYMLNSEDS